MIFFTEKPTWINCPVILCKATRNETDKGRKVRGSNGFSAISTIVGLSVSSRSWRFWFQPKRLSSTNEKRRKQINFHSSRFSLLWATKDFLEINRAEVNAPDPTRLRYSEDRIRDSSDGNFVEFPSIWLDERNKVLNERKQIFSSCSSFS